MNKEFVPYEQALALKELGFDEPCFRFKNNISNIYEEKGCFNWNQTELFDSIPLYQQAFRWLLDKHYLYGIVIPTVTMDWTFKTMTVAQGMVEVPPYNHVDAYDYSSKEEAELECLKKLIEIVKTNK